MSDLVRTSIDGAVAEVTLNRPEARNPTSIAMLAAMDAAFDAVVAAPDVRVIILGGAGRSFCSGLDLDEVLAGGDTVHTLLTRLSEVMRRIRRLPCVTIARGQGAAIGGGFGFLAAADFAVSHAEAKIGYPPLSTCLSPALMAPWLIRKVGASRARAMLLAGGTISGQAAYEAGIVTHLEPRERLEEATRHLAGVVTAGGRHAMLAMKSLLNELEGSLDDAALDRAAAVSAEVIAGPEAQARLREIFESRRSSGG